MFSHAAACQTCRGVGLALPCESQFGGNVFWGNVPVFIHVHVADEIGHNLDQVSGSGAQDNRRNVAVNVHVMKCLLLCVFSHAAACQT